jgi:hypothetical protein
MTNKRELDSNWRNNANVRIRSDLNSLEQRELKSVTRREDFNAKIIAKIMGFVFDIEIVKTNAKLNVFLHC